MVHFGRPLKCTCTEGSIGSHVAHHGGNACTACAPLSCLLPLLTNPPTRCKTGVAVPTPATLDDAAGLHPLHLSLFQNVALPLLLRVRVCVGCGPAVCIQVLPYHFRRSSRWSFISLGSRTYRAVLNGQRGGGVLSHTEALHDWHGSPVRTLAWW